MKRCPDCGFRANDQMCPLCGVRMKEDPNLRTHVHAQSGERCGVSGKEANRRPEQYRPAAKPKTEFASPFSVFGDLGKPILKIIGYIAAFLILSGGCSAFF